MKFIKAHHDVQDLAVDIEKYIQNKEYNAEDLVVVTLEEHVSDVKSMVSTDIETVNENDFKTEEPLNNYGLAGKDVKLYDSVLRSGGYVVLLKDEDHAFTENESDKRGNNKSDDVNLHAPGFGVDIDNPDSSTENHEDNFNPENPNPQAGE